MTLVSNGIVLEMIHVIFAGGQPIAVGQRSMDCT